MDSFALKVLITNARLDGFTGTEVVVRDLASELQRLGHRVMVYSPILGAMAVVIKDAGIRVTDRLDALTEIPDVIHGHHHGPLLEALLFFPSTPAAFICHSAAYPLDDPFYFPRILRYVAVDACCRARLEAAANIPKQRIEVISNAVDLRRFLPRGVLPARPARALVFSNYADSHTHLPSVRRACSRMGMAADVIGALMGAGVADPERVLPQYDVVFAKARCAMEAMAVGCAVVLCDFPGAGPMVNSENFDRLRALNFGQATLVNPLQTKFIRMEIARYDPADAARVAWRIREQAGLQTAVRQWTSLYAAMVAEFHGSEPDREGELRAVAGYLRTWSYAKGLEPTQKIMRRIRQIPVVGSRLYFFSRKIARRWSAG